MLFLSHTFIFTFLLLWLVLIFRLPTLIPSEFYLFTKSSLLKEYGYLTPKSELQIWGDPERENFSSFIAPDSHSVLILVLKPIRDPKSCLTKDPIKDHFIKTPPLLNLRNGYKLRETGACVKKLILIEWENYMQNLKTGNGRMKNNFSWYSKDFKYYRISS